jgi:hypothetical protein
MSAESFTFENPYTPMLVKFQPGRVYGWAQEIARLLQVVTGPEPTSYAIYGIRPIGKTTLLRYLKHPRGAVRRYEQHVDADYRTELRQLLWVYVNFHLMFEDMHVLAVMFEHLQDELTQKGYNTLLDVDPPGPEEPKRRFAAKLRNLLQTLDEDYATRVIFLMDDFDIPLLADQITRNEDYLLRTISDFAPMVIATDEPIHRLRPDIAKGSPLLGILRPERIGLIEEKAARQLICQPAEAAGVRFIEAEVHMLLAVGGRFPVLLIVTCETYFEMRLSIEDIDATFATPAKMRDLKRQLLDRLLLTPHVDHVLNMIWAKHEDLQPTLIQMAASDDVSFNGSNAILTEQYSLSYLYPDATSPGYRIFSHLFAEFIRRKASQDAIGMPSGIHHNRHGSGSAAVMELDPALTGILDGLPPIERGVLNYLAARAGEICTFEELLEAVWEDGTGTKRALEAAVHRLRRTVPGGHEIKNIRGTGYKYIITNSERV